MEWKNFLCLFLLASFELGFCVDENVEFSCNDLHALYDESKHFVNLRRIYNSLLRKNGVTLSEDGVGYEFFRAKPLEFNISEEYSKAEIFIQTASLFYDHIKNNSIDNDIPTYFQNFSHCFLERKASTEASNETYSFYRTIDGSNNNLKNKAMGASSTSFGRFLKSSYDDNIHSPRKSIRGYNLPSPRNIVRKLFLNDEINLHKFSGRKNIPNIGAVMFGQYISNDVGGRQMSQYVDGEGAIRCCSNFNKIQLPTSLLHSSCLPITISKSDPFYSPQDIKCMNFVRSHVISNHPLRVNLGEQVNTVTSYLDHSNIYGSDYKTARKLRSFNAGRLRTSLKNILPLENGNYFSGDERVNQTPFIAIWHSIYVRNHNRLADKLSIINRHWDDEKIFQEARKINIAVYQKIIYKEWLPIFLGKNSSTLLENVSYDPKIDASTSNEFSSSAFRIFHSFIDTNFKIYDESFHEKLFNISDTFSKPKILDNFYDDILRGFQKQKMRLVGYSKEVLNKLFKNKDGVGLDLLSIDVMRGRDHGIPSYHKFRKSCNMKSNIKVFNDLYPEVPKNSITQLRQTYKSVFDVDLLVGGAMESVIAGTNATNDDAGFFGPTFRCLIEEQFYRFKAGDHYFYTSSSHFSEGQLEVIEKYSMAHLMCENSDISKVFENFFLSESEDNPTIECRKLEHKNLSRWREIV